MLTASLLIGFALKSLVLAAATLGLLRLARRATPAERSLIAHLGLTAILLLPVASIVLPAWAPLPTELVASGTVEPITQAPVSGAPASPAALAPETASVVSDAPSALLSLEQVAVALYVLPLALMFAMMLLAVMRLFGMRRRAEVLVDGAWLSALAGAQRRMGFKHGTALLVSEELRSPISWGVLRPTILLDPRAVGAVGDAEAIIAHELAHVARLDWAKLLIARLACALFWFNPLVWMLARESHQLREEAADDSVLLTDIAGSDYATLLVNAARHDNSGSLIAAHGVAPGKNSLRRRVIRVLDASVRRGPAHAGWSALTLVAVLAIAGPLAAFTTVATRSPAQPEVAAVATGEQVVARAHPERRREGGPRTLTADDLVAMRAVGVEPADIAPLRDSRGEVDSDAVVAAKAVGATPDYVAQMRSVIAGADADELIGARAVGVDPTYARAMRAIDASADLDTVIGARAVGVTTGYAQDIRRYFPHISLEDLVGMRATGVTSRDIQAMRASGMDVGSPDDVVGAHAAVTGRRGPRSGTPHGSTAISVGRDGSVFSAGPGGVVATQRNSDGTVTTVVAHSPSPPADADDD